MIHYHGADINPMSQLLRMAGRHFCVSHAYPRHLDRCLRIGQSVMFDNGAFTAWRNGRPMDVAAYSAWLDPVLVHPHWAVVPDVIDGDVIAQRELAATWTYPKELSAPVWHLGLPLDYLLELCDTWPRVCLGSSGEFAQIGTIRWCSRMDQAFNAMAQRFRRLPWVHGLRMLGQAEGPWPLASADSTNVAQNFKRDTGCAECKAAPIDAVNPPSLWNPQPIQGTL